MIQEFNALAHGRDTPAGGDGASQARPESAINSIKTTYYSDIQRLLPAARTRLPGRCGTTKNPRRGAPVQGFNAR
jgi:hypothetical protein